MRFHHHTTRSVCCVRKTAAQSLIVQYVPTQSQRSASVGHRSARATSETSAAVTQYDSFGSTVKQNATRAGQNVLVLQRDPVRPDPGPGNLDLTASEREDFLGVLVVEGYSGSGARGSGQRNRRARSLRRAHDQLLGPRVTLAHGSHKANPLIFGTRSVEENRPESRFHRHTTPLVNTRLVTIVTQSRCRTRSLDAYVPASRVNLSVIGRGRPKLNTGLSVRGTVSGRNHASVIASSDRDLPPSRIIVSRSTVCRIDHIVVSKNDRTTRTVVAVRPKSYVPIVGQEAPTRNRLNLPRPLQQNVRSAQSRGQVHFKIHVSAVNCDRTIHVQIGFDFNRCHRVVLVQDKPSYSRVIFDHQMPERTPPIPSESKDSRSYLRNGTVPIQNASGRTIGSSEKFGSEISIIWLDFEDTGKRERSLPPPRTRLGSVESNQVGSKGDRTRTGSNADIGRTRPEKQNIRSLKEGSSPTDCNIRIRDNVRTVNRDRTGNGNGCYNPYVRAIGRFSNPQARDRIGEVYVLVVKKGGKRGVLRLHHHPPRGRHGIRKPAEKVLVVDHVTSNR